MDNAIMVKNLIKSYEKNTVIHGISFEIPQGEIFGLLGINGAGKTTILECLEGLRLYDSGEIYLKGTIGVQLQSTALPNGIRTEEAIQLFSKWNRVPCNHDLIHNLSLEPFRKKAYKELSTGQKRRLHLALAMIHNPDILFLDEPTAGLDVEGRVALHKEIKKLKSLGKTIILASHDMAEVEELCDRIAILKKGKIVFMGTSNELTKSLGNESKILLHISEPQSLTSLKYSEYHGMDKQYMVFHTKDLGESLLELLQCIKIEGMDLYDLKIERVSLEQKFLDIIKEETL